jgi:hypothetical protein
VAVLSRAIREVTAEILATANALAETPPPTGARTAADEHCAGTPKDEPAIRRMVEGERYRDRGLGGGIYALAEIRHTLRDDDLRRVARLEESRRNGR